MGELYDVLKSNGLRGGTGGGSGFTPTQSQLDAMNSGITEQKVNGINHLVFSANSKTYYLQPEQPQNPQDGDIWIG